MRDFSLRDKLGTASAYGEKAGAIIDECRELFEQLTIFSLELMQFDKEGKMLKEAVDTFERRSCFEEDNSASAVILMHWLHLDYRFGQMKETVCERFMKEYVFRKLAPQKQAIVRKMAESYAGFYEVVDVLNDKIIFKELLGGKKWFVHKINQSFEKDAAIKDIWYVRFVGSHEDACIYPPPFIFPSRFKQTFVKAMEKQKKLVIRLHKNEILSDEEILRESYKKMLAMWGIDGPEQRAAEA